VDEPSGEAVERQTAGGELLLLGWGKGGDHEAVTDIHAELIPRATTRRMRVEPSPQAFGHGAAAAADLQVLGGHGPSAHSHIDQPVTVPDGVDASGTLGNLIVGPVPEAVKRPDLRLMPFKPHLPDANRLAHNTIGDQLRQTGTGNRVDAPWGMEQRRQKIPDPGVCDQGVISDTLASLVAAERTAASMDPEALGGKQWYLIL
jgi:hypothetical protein